MTAGQVDRQERRKRRTRQAIQTAALELFAERGYRETTINDIAERADVAPRTVTVHFPAKEELLFDAEPFTLDGLSKRLSGRQPHETALEALRDWMAATMTNHYPLALERIVRGLVRGALNPANILISLDNRYVNASWGTQEGSRTQQRQTGDLMKYLHPSPVSLIRQVAKSCKSGGQTAWEQA